MRWIMGNQAYMLYDDMMYDKGHTTLFSCVGHASKEKHDSIYLVEKSISCYDDESDCIIRQGWMWDWETSEMMDQYFRINVRSAWSQHMDKPGSALANLDEFLKEVYKAKMSWERMAKDVIRNAEALT